MSTSLPIPDTTHPALEARPPRPPSTPLPGHDRARQAALAADGGTWNLVPPIAGQPADIAFLTELRLEAHRLGGVLHHSREAEAKIFVDDPLARARFDAAPKRPRILLARNATRYEALTEMARLRHYHAVGRDAYRGMSPLARAQGDFDRLAADPGWQRFTGAERAHAAATLLALGGSVDRATHRAHQDGSDGGGGGESRPSDAGGSAPGTGALP